MPAEWWGGHGSGCWQLAENLGLTHLSAVVAQDPSFANVNDAPTGTPLSVYRDQIDGSEYYYTLVVPADTHRLIPCFGSPKAQTHLVRTR